MQLFKNNIQVLSELKEIPFKLEKDIQTLFERNLASLTTLTFVKSEFTIKSNRIDTLAFDEENKAFVIIEYKRGQHHSVFDQGVSYLNLMLEYGSEFIMEYNESQHKSLKRNDIDWSQSKIIFVSPSFNDFQKKATDFKDLAIELWEIKQFENEVIVINPLKKSKSAPSIKQIQSTDNNIISKVTDEIRVYTEEDHLANKSAMIKELYEVYKEAILNLADDISIVPKKLYISFEKNKRIILDLVPQLQEIKLYINTQYSHFQDLQQLGVSMNDKTKWGKGYYQIILKDTEKLEYILSLIKQLL